MLFRKTSFTPAIVLHVALCLLDAHVDKLATTTVEAEGTSGLCF